MKRVTYKWSDILGLVGFAVFLVFMIDMNENIELWQKRAIEAGIIIIGLFLASRQKVVIDTKTGYITYPVMLLFRGRIKLSDIESYDVEEEPDVDENGNVRRTYHLNLYGPFGSKTLKFSSSKEVKSMINHLNNI